MSSAVSPAPDRKALPSAGNLLTATFAIYRHKFSVIIGYSGWLLVPLIATVALRVTLGMNETAQVLGRIIELVSVVLSVWVYASIVLTVAQESKSNDTAATSLRPQAITIFFVLVFYYLLVLFGTALLVVPGIVFGVLLCYAPASAILDRTGFVASFVQSRDLVRGMFWVTLGRLCSMAVLVVAIYLLLAAILAACFPTTLTADLASGLPLPVDVILSLGEILLTPITIIYVTLLYLARKNG